MTLIPQPMMAGKKKPHGISAQHQGLELEGVFHEGIPCDCLPLNRSLGKKSLRSMLPLRMPMALPLWGGRPPEEFTLFFGEFLR